MVETICELLIYVAAVFAIAFPVLYFTRSPWRRTAEGRMMMNLGTAIALVFVLILTNLFFGPHYPGRDWIRLFAYAYLALAFVRLNFVLARVQWRVRHGYYDHSPQEARHP